MRSARFAPGSADGGERDACTVGAYSGEAVRRRMRLLVVGLGLLGLVSGQSDDADAAVFCTGDPMAESSAACLLARHGCELSLSRRPLCPILPARSVPELNRCCRLPQTRSSSTPSRTADIRQHLISTATVGSRMTS